MLTDSIIFWLARPISEVAFCLFAAISIVVAVFIVSLPHAMRQRRCKHMQVFETQACDAICAHCAKNLGFIGNWRAKQPKEKTPC